MTPSSLWERILQVAVWTPSPHNTQPWKLKIIGEMEADLFIDHSRMLPDEDVTENFIQCAMGMFLEALYIVAANEGFQLKHEFLPSETAGNLIPFAKIKLSKAAVSESVYSNDLFRQRQTSRLNYRISETGIRESAQALILDGSQTYHEILDSKMIEVILDKNIDAVFDDLNAPKYHDEIIRWFRCSSREANQQRDGLDSRCMNMPGLEMRLMARFPFFMRAALTRPLMKRLYRYQLGSSPVLGILCGPFWEPAKAVKAGRFLLRFWLELAKRQLYIHPFGNLVTNAQASAWMKENLKLSDIWLVFRIGKTNAPPRSQRLPLEDLLVH